MNINYLHKRALKAGAAMPVLAIFGAGLFATPAFAQDDDLDSPPTVLPGAACDPASGLDCPDDGEPLITVTGSILRTTKEDASPITVIQADELETRGVTTVEEAIQNLSANGAGTLPNAFTANGAFAAGASAASLRGLTTSSTLVLFDGLRAAYYPLADDGTRNFVDLNTIPDAIVERVEVLKDGASSTYGADAIAGVINIITKRQVTGLHFGAEAGIAQGGYAGQQNIEATYGFGDLDENGINVYVSGRYFHRDIVYNRQLDAPFNSGRAATTLCNADGTDCVDATTGLFLGGREFDGSLSGLVTISLVSVPLSRPYSVNANGTAGAPLGGYELQDPALGCQGNPQTNLTAAEQAGLAGLYDSPIMCQYDLYENFGVVEPESERINASMRATARITDTMEGYIQLNYAQSDVFYDFYDASILRASAPASTGITYNINPLFLPVYICPGATVGAGGNPEQNGCTAANGTLNPNNPYAAQGLISRYGGPLYDINEESRYKTDAYRAAFGLTGDITDNWYFDIAGTAMKVDLERTLDGRVYIANFLQAVAEGTYNFRDPSQNSEELRQFIAPTINNRSTSEMYQLQGTVGTDLMMLPGGPLQLGVGASIRHERVNAPGADGDNSDNPQLVDPLQRYTSRVNPFGSEGSRTVRSVFAELNAPIVDMVEVNLSGRYDDYSTGQNYFSPKVGVQITPVPQLLLRGTYSRGFRIGSFAEFGADPTTGYITGTGTIPANIVAAYTAANGGTAPTYITSYSLGLTQSGNPNLDPEKSESITLGIVAEPIRNVSFTVDYFRIKKTDLITGADYTPALEAYYAGQPIPEGFNVIPDDPALGPQFAGLIPRAAFVTYSFTNKDSGIAEGIDFSAAAQFEVMPGVNFSTSVEASRLLELSQTVDGVKQEYQGSIGPYVITSAAGSPKWRGSWQNTLDFGQWFVSATAYYTSGYSTSAEDITGEDTKDDCDSSLSAHFLNSGDPFQCRVDSFTYVNLTTGFDVNDDVRFYVNVVNLFDTDPPIDTATYGAHFYNPAWHHVGAIGRYFKAGIKAKF